MTAFAPRTTATAVLPGFAASHHHQSLDHHASARPIHAAAISRSGCSSVAVGSTTTLSAPFLRSGGSRSSFAANGPPPGSARCRSSRRAYAAQRQHDSKWSLCAVTPTSERRAMVPCRRATRRGCDPLPLAVRRVCGVIEPSFDQLGHSRAAHSRKEPAVRPQGVVQRGCRHAKPDVARSPRRGARCGPCAAHWNTAGAARFPAPRTPVELVAQPHSLVCQMRNSRRARTPARLRGPTSCRRSVGDGRRQDAIDGATPLVQFRCAAQVDDSSDRAVSGRRLGGRQSIHPRPHTGGATGGPSRRPSRAARVPELV